MAWTLFSSSSEELLGVVESGQVMELAEDQRQDQRGVGGGRGQEAVQ